MDNRNKILQLVRMKGPLLPSQINKEINTNLLFASAMLSELVDKKIIKLTRMKVGGSPLYYAPGQEYKLQEFSDKLGSKEKVGYEALKNSMVLMDREQEPIVRAALRLIADFAKPIEITHHGENLLFWKWHMLTDDKTEQLIKNILGIEEKQERLKEEKEKVGEKLKNEEDIEKEEENNAKLDERRKEIEKQERLLKKKEEEIKNRLKDIENDKDREHEKKDVPLMRDSIEPDDEFYKQVKDYFNEKKIIIRNYKIIRKNSEMDLMVEVPSSVGNLNYYCKAKNKKKCNDGDLSTAFVQGQAKKLPILFITTGDITKKAEAILSTEFKNMTIKII